MPVAFAPVLEKQRPYSRHIVGGVLISGGVGALNAALAGRSFDLETHRLKALHLVSNLGKIHPEQVPDALKDRWRKAALGHGSHKRDARRRVNIGGVGGGDSAEAFGKSNVKFSIKLGDDECRERFSILRPARFLRGEGHFSSPVT